MFSLSLYFAPPAPDFEGIFAFLIAGLALSS